MEYIRKVIIFGILHTEKSISSFSLSIRTRNINYKYVFEYKSGITDN
jgi:hypothetical protein